MVNINYPIHAFQVTNQLGTHMDWFSTALDVAGIQPPNDRIIDGISLLPLFKRGSEIDRYNYIHTSVFVSGIIYGADTYSI